jgi:hypothetical protein
MKQKTDKTGAGDQKTAIGGTGDQKAASNDQKTNFIIEHRLKAVKGKTELRAAYTKEFGSAIGFEHAYKCAMDIIGEYYNPDTEAGTAEIAMHLWTLYEKSMKLQDYRECRAILMEIHKITILKPPAGKEAEVLDIFARPQKAVVNK